MDDTRFQCFTKPDGAQVLQRRRISRPWVLGGAFFHRTWGYHRGVSTMTLEWAGSRLSSDQRETIRRWLQQPRYADQREPLQELLRRAEAGEEDAFAALEDAFDGPLPIGTGGRRGRCGPGPNRLNTVVLRETAQGLADAMHAEGVPPRVAVVYDTRRDSRRFAQAVAEQLAANDLEVVLVDAPRPTPELSFVVRAQQCGGGVVISASHNPPEDNGIKIYDADGAQVLGDRDRALMLAIENAMNPDRPLPEMRSSQAERIRWLQTEQALAEVDGPYHRFVAEQGVLPGSLADAGVSIAFTPLHGVGHTSVLPVLRQRELEVHPVQRQCDPDDGRFSTVETANPEAAASMAMALRLAEDRGADLVMATDPDADRLGALVRDRSGRYQVVDGNRLGVLMLDHVLRCQQPPARAWVLTTLVTSPLVRALAERAGVDVVDDLLVGFKHHAGMMREQSDRPLLFACEESHGYLRGTAVRDKDGAIAALLLAECAAAAKRDGDTLLDRLAQIWRVHGYHREQTANLFAGGVAGRQAITSVMDAWRSQPPKVFGGLSVTEVDDRSKPRQTDSPTRNLPGNVISFELEGAGEGVACRLVLRPSGTEPKLKLYALARGGGGIGADELPEQIERVDTLVERVLADAREAARAIMGPAAR